MRRKRPRTRPRRKFSDVPLLAKYAQCEDGRVVALRVPYQCGGERHFIAVDVTGRFILEAHPSMDMIAAFTAFGAAKPHCMEIIEAHDSNPLYWLVARFAYQNMLSPEAHNELLIRMAEHALPLYKKCPNFSKNAMQKTKRVLSEARHHCAGTFGPGYKKILDEDVDAMRVYIRGLECPCARAVMSVVWIAVNGLDQPQRQGHNINLVSRATDGLIRESTPQADDGRKIIEERRWQAAQFIEVLDGEKICPS